MGASQRIELGENKILQSDENIDLKIDSDNDKKIKKRLDRDRNVSLLDSDTFKGENLNDFLIETTKAQTFLGAASFIYHPKPVKIINLAYG